MDSLTKSAVVRLLAAMTDDEFTTLVVESRGVDSEQVDDLLRAAEYHQLTMQTAKNTAAQSLRDRIGG